MEMEKGRTEGTDIRLPAKEVQGRLLLKPVLVFDDGPSISLLPVVVEAVGASMGHVADVEVGSEVGMI
jgi:hypothetical protein